MRGLEKAIVAQDVNPTLYHNVHEIQYNYCRTSYLFHFIYIFFYCIHKNVSYMDDCNFYLLSACKFLTSKALNTVIVFIIIFLI